MTCCDTCGAEPCINPSFCRTCKRADGKHRRQAVVIALRPTPQVTIEGVVAAVRERGVKALTEPATLRRLGGCDEAARAEINRRLDALLRETAA
jgi:hypothetical protein